MKIKELESQLETNSGEIVYEGKCHDCNKDVTVCVFKDEKAGAIIIEGGAVYNLVVNDTKQLFFKCDSCFQKDKTLRNWQECEVYSRIVGYLRPVQQWNKGKKEEWRMRKVFSNTETKKKGK